jgi:hypothetical protein
MVAARIGKLAALALAPALLGCAQTAPPSSPVGSVPAACQQEAQRLGFAVLGNGTPEPQADGSTVYPVLVQWGNDGGVHLHCRVGAGGVTIG